MGEEGEKEGEGKGGKEKGKRKGEKIKLLVVVNSVLIHDLSLLVVAVQTRTLINLSINSTALSAVYKREGKERG